MDNGPLTIITLINHFVIQSISIGLNIDWTIGPLDPWTIVLINVSDQWSFLPDGTNYFEQFFDWVFSCQNFCAGS